MKKIGLLGGMTCESSVEYYRLINEGVRARLGGIHSAESIMVSVDFGVIQPLMEADDWTGVLRHLVEASLRVERAGAGFLVLCTNTMHKLADQIAAEVSLPILNIIDATASEIKKLDLATVGLLGTRFTMTQGFYTQRLAERHGIETIIPTSEEVADIHRVIMEELTVGRIDPGSKARYWAIMRNLEKRGAQGMILGCTEIPLLVKQEEGEIPLFDTTAIHADAAVSRALA
jgi:aspartate racemase